VKGVLVVKEKIDPEDVVQHLSPAWQTKADYLVHGRIEEGINKKWEQLWAKDLKNGKYEICCIPFCIYDLALGDHVEINNKNTLGNVIKRSGNWTIRAWFGEISDDQQDEEKTAVINKVRNQLGCLVEWQSARMLAINVASNETAKDVVQYLKEKQDHGDMVYETGWS